MSNLLSYMCAYLWHDHQSVVRSDLLTAGRTHSDFVIGHSFVIRHWQVAEPIESESGSTYDSDDALQPQPIPRQTAQLTGVPRSGTLEYQRMHLRQKRIWRREW